MVAFRPIVPSMVMVFDQTYVAYNIMCPGIKPVYFYFNALSSQRCMLSAQYIN